jgi:hypothetical protein
MPPAGAGANPGADTATDLGVRADSESKGMKMTTKTPANVTDIEDTSTSRWLAGTLNDARADVQGVPTAEAVDRIRARVLSETAQRKTQRSIAA